MAKASNTSSSSPQSIHRDLWPFVMAIDNRNPESWSVDDVSKFLETNGFNNYIELFSDVHQIDGKSLLTLTENDLRCPPLELKVLGDIKRLAICIKKLQLANKSVLNDFLPFNTFSNPGHYQISPLISPTTSTLASEGIGHSCNMIADSLLSPSLMCCNRSSNSLPTSVKQQLPCTCPRHSTKHVTCRHDVHATDDDTEYSLSSESEGEEDNGNHDDDDAHVNGSDRSDRSNGQRSDRSNGNGSNGSKTVNGRNRGHDRIHQEPWKALIAMFYFFCVTLITAFVMVIVHDRVPDMATYPPLPDIFLDNVPLIPWAFKMCELCGLILFIMWCKILVFHKYRFILLRRMFSLFGSVFLLRCVTMLITSLSVPGRHLECKARPYGSWNERLTQAYVIWQGGGMSLQGVRTCGDYMFSGHTVVITLLNFFITEYTPASLYYVHTLSWVLNLFGIFFILAGHEHYSIDVFIAFYISTRLFLYYHTLANNRALYQPDRRRTKVWFPLFSFFESGVNGIVPNHFDCNISMKSLTNLIIKFKNKVKELKNTKNTIKKIEESSKQRTGGNNLTTNLPNVACQVTNRRNKLLSRNKSD